MALWAQAYSNAAEARIDVRGVSTCPVTVRPSMDMKPFMRWNELEFQRHNERDLLRFYCDFIITGSMRIVWENCLYLQLEPGNNVAQGEGSVRWTGLPPQRLTKPVRVGDFRDTVIQYRLHVDVTGLIPGGRKAILKITVHPGISLQMVIDRSGIVGNHELNSWLDLWGLNTDQGYKETATLMLEKWVTWTMVSGSAGLLLLEDGKVMLEGTWNTGPPVNTNHDIPRTKLIGVSLDYQGEGERGEGVKVKISHVRFVRGGEEAEDEE
ncbi:hypothetical protein BDZ91DRAFT_801031 [Kalaharituber pfeilii]|nr:hypothetical protein BDZ91DRAFT_801031 [Kalaharituber pfeilii]